MTSRTPTRAQLGQAAVFSPEEAATLLPWRDAVGRAWLRRKGLVREEMMEGGEVAEYVLWDEVLRTLRAEHGGERTARLPATLDGLKRRAL